MVASMLDCRQIYASNHRRRLDTPGGIVGGEGAQPMVNPGMAPIGQCPRLGHDGRPVCSYNLGIFCTVEFLAYENTKIWRKNTIINVSRHVLQFVCLPVQNMPSSRILVAHVSVMTSHCCTVGFSCALCSPSTEFSGCVFLLQSMSIHHCLFLEARLCWNYFHWQKKESEKK